MEDFAVLNDGNKIPLVGLGTGTIDTPDHVVEQAVLAAVQAGYRHFDCADMYGSKIALGNALNKAFNEGLVARNEVFITSKLWCSDLHPDDVLPTIHRILKEMRLEYLDLFLIHWPVRVKKDAPIMRYDSDSFLPVDIPATWKSMEKCVEMKLTRSIGVSNFSAKKIKDLLVSASIPPAVNQVEMHPNWNQKSLREFCKENNVHVTAYSPLGAQSNFSFINASGILTHPHVLSIASKHGKTPSQIVLRWEIEEGVSVIPKSCNAERIRENINIFDFCLDEDDKELMNKMEQRKVFAGDVFVNPEGGPYRTLFELWDEELPS